VLFAVLLGCRGERRGAGTVTVHIATTRGSLLFFPVHLAYALGYYAQEGIDLVIDEMASAPN
jgi:hypothetical protein